MTTRICASCLIEKPLTAFEKCRNGRMKSCAKCMYAKYKPAIDARRARKGEAEKRYEYQKKYNSRPEVKERVRAYKRRRRELFINRLGTRLSSSIYRGLRYKTHRRRWETLVGYSVHELKVHLEKQFTKGMSWANFGEWHIDHIVPVKTFKISGVDDPAIKICWGLANLRPLWAIENIRKQGKREFLL